MNLRALATSTKPLSEVFVDRVRGGVGFSRLARTLPVSEEDDDREHSFDCGSDPLPSVKPSRACASDVAAAAILLGRAFEASRHTLARLLEPDAVNIIQVHHPDLVKPVRRFLGILLASDTSLVDDDELNDRGPTTGKRSLIVFGEHTKSTASVEDQDRGVAIAMRLRCPVVGITTAFGRLPRALVRLAEHRVVVPPIDAVVVADVIEAVTGTRPKTVDASMAARVTINDLAIAVRDDVGAERSLERLQRLVEPQATHDVPPLAELAGLGEAKTFCMEVADSMRAYLAGERPWSEAPHGLLVSGPPGTGKTSLMRSLARELPNVHFIATSYAQWQAHKSGHLGDVTSCIRATFSEAFQRRPSIVYIDECDVLPARGSGGKHDSWFTAIVTTLLECIQGFEQVEGVFVCASCNDPTRLDPALTRAGRLDHHIRVELPDVAGLMGIFRTHLRSDCAGADLREAALAACGHSGADVEKWVRMARQAARKSGRDVTVEDVVAAIRGGEPDLPADLRRCIAYHEAGHAIAHLTLGTATPKSLSIGGDGGRAESKTGRLQLPTRDYLEKLLMTILAGRAAEQLKFGEATTGAGGTSAESDLVRATNLALRIETSYGYGHSGLVTLAEGQLSDGYLLMTEPLRSATNETLMRAYAKSLSILEQNSQALDALAKALFAVGYLDQSEIAAVIATHPLVPAIPDLARATTMPPPD
ncbi:AAA family ATPase [Bradyrhizobium liaoningense]|uniref:AAA family ATPase n=1 Tax=Bradyrhizobium liaoningense TaxID=43992 RepID=UPI001BAC9B6E|nr:AAA family ATPase [Bradyrhizobium liaoningense]MBR0821474.1 AAA family ATPase [Bradyrhizobium liaoningense]